jgi:hypothetical protein
LRGDGGHLPQIHGGLVGGREQEALQGPVLGLGFVGPPGGEHGGEQDGHPQQAGSRSLKERAIRPERQPE